MEILTKKFIKDFFHRNKKTLLIILIVFLITAIITAIYVNIKTGANVGIISQMMHNTIPQNTGNTSTSMEISSTYIFIHNLTTDLLISLGGVLFSIFSVIISIFNIVSVSSIFGSDLEFACVSVLPHGIIEYTATIFALLIALKITKIEIGIIKTKSIKGLKEKYNTELKDILLALIIMIILLLIAAIIEGHITLLITSWHYGV